MTRTDTIDLHVLRHEIGAARRLLTSASNMELDQFCSVDAENVIRHNIEELVRIYSDASADADGNVEIRISRSDAFSLAERLVEMVCAEAVTLVPAEIDMAFADQLDELDTFCADAIAEQPAGRWMIALD